mgnify:CR=1 FL=1
MVHTMERDFKLHLRLVVEMESGGCGVRREWQFLEDVQVSVITQSRIFAPRGRAGGGPGRQGIQWVRLNSGATTVLRCVDQVDCAAGDVLVVETPGGGGWGPDVPNS